MTGAGGRGQGGKVALVVTQSGSGGVRELWMNLADGFARNGYEVCLLALYGSVLDDNDVAPPEWHHICARRPGSPTGLMRMMRGLRRWLGAERPDVIFTAQPVANVLVPLFARIFSPATRVIVTHHSPVQTYHPALGAADGFSGRLRNVARVLGVSEGVSASLAGRAPAYRAKQVTVRNALPPTLAAELTRLRLRQAPRDPARRRLVTTGRLAEQKNYPLLLRGMALLPDVSLDIFGAGPDEDALKALADSLGVSGRVRFNGPRLRQELMPLLADHDVFVQVSLFEGHSLALVEAATLGLPLIVSSVPEQVEATTLPDGTRCALAVAIDDAPGLAAAVSALLDDPLAYREACDRASRLAECWTFDDMMHAYVRLADGDDGEVRVDPSSMHE